MENSIIDIRNLLWNTAKQWRKIVIGMIIGAVIVGGYGAYSAMKTATADVSGTQAEIDALNAKLEVKKAEQESLQKYADESLYMQMDYLNVVSTMFTIYVNPIEKVLGQTESVTNPTGELVHMYYTYIITDELYQEINEILGYSINYTNEIFTFQTDSYSGFLCFTIRSNSKENNEKVADIISKYAQSVYSDLNKNTYVHELVISDCNSILVEVSEINTNNTIKRANLKDTNEDVTELQAKILLLQQVIDNKSNRVGLAITVLIYFVLGMILGGGAVVFLLLIMPLILNRIQGGRYIELEHHLTVFATKSLFTEGKNPIDKFLYKCGSRGTIRTEADFLEYAVQSINVCTVEGELVHLTGTIEAAWIKDFCEQIQDKVHAKLSYGGDIAGEIGSLADIAKSDSVILVEGVFRTVDRALEREIYHINKLNKNIKGVVLL